MLKGELSDAKQTLAQTEQQIVTLKAQLNEAQQTQPRMGVTSPGSSRGRGESFQDLWALSRCLIYLLIDSFRLE